MTKVNLGKETSAAKHTGSNKAAAAAVVAWRTAKGL